MGTAVFAFSVRGDALDERYLPIRTDSDLEQSAGRGYRRQRGRRFIARDGYLIFPDTIANKSYDDWDTFFETTLMGGADSCLYAPANPFHREIADEALGVSAGGAGDTFSLASKFVDASTLVVKVDGVVDANWSLSGNYTAPLITTTAGFAAGAITASHDKYFQMLVDVIRTANLVQGPSRTSPGTLRVSFRLIELDSGGSLA